MKLTTEVKKTLCLSMELDESCLDTLTHEIDYLLGINSGLDKTMGMHVLPELYNALITTLEEDF